MAALHAACFTVPRPWTASEFAALLADPTVFCATAPGGMILGRVVAAEAELLTLAVAPDRRRQGHGAALLKAYEAAAVARQALESFLEVAADNHAACLLYRHAGYREAGRRRGYFRHPDGTRTDALVLRRPLPRE